MPVLKAVDVNINNEELLGHYLLMFVELFL